MATNPQDPLDLLDELEDATDSAVLVDDGAREERRQVESAAAADFGTSPGMIYGVLNLTPVASVLGRLWRERLTGALLLRQQRTKKVLYVKNGDTYFARSNRVNECLGKLLVRERMITPEQCEDSIAAMKTTGQQQGEALVQMGAITQRNLAFALELQMETKLFDCFTWLEGEYRFNSSVVLPKTDVQLEWQGAAVIVEGVRRAFDETRLHPLLVPMIDTEIDWREGRPDGQDLGFTSREANAIKQFMLPATTRALLGHTGLDTVNSMRVLYALIALGLLGPASKS